MKIEDIRQGVGSLWDAMTDAVTDGWDRLRRSAGALTRFRSGEQTALPPRSEIDDAFYLPNQAWAVLGSDVFEDDERLIVRIEAPGLEKEDFNVQVSGDTLVVTGEKRFERALTEGRWRVLQCAYGSFRRTVPLPIAVRSDDTRATYRNGVLRIEMPKAIVAKPRSVDVTVS